MTLEDIERVKRAVIRNYPISAGIALKNVKIELTDTIETAAVVGKTNEAGKLEVSELKINPIFFESLTFSERVFVLAHEAFHIALKHFSRSIEKPKKDIERKYQEYCKIEQNEQKREMMKIKLHQKYNRIWNIATDACINAFLKKDGLTFPNNVINPKTGQKMQFVDMEVGLYKSAEKIYDHLVRIDEEKQEKNEQSKEENPQINQNNSQTTNGSTNIDNVDIDSYNGIDSHDEWTDRVSKEENREQNESKDDGDVFPNETEIFEQEIKNRQNKTKKDLKTALKGIREGLGISDYTQAKPVIPWQRLLVGTLEETKEVWGTRRASRFNPNPRIEERIYETMPSVEIILDTSGSISADLLKGFLIQLCTLFESMYGTEMKIKVGCFADKFSGFTEIKSTKDVINYTPAVTGGTNFEVAATSFSKNSHNTTKIVFTDGGVGVSQRTRVDDIFWIVFGNYSNFKPVGGKIIKVSNQEYDKMIKTGEKLRLQGENIYESKYRKK